MKINPEFSIILIDNPSLEQYRILSNGIRNHAQEMKGFEERKQHGAFFIKMNEEIVGGIGFYVNLGALEIEKLWVSKSYRNQRLGSQLLEKVEAEGKIRSCRFATLGTGDWEALGFYLKHNYSIEFKREGYDENSIYYFLKKEF